MCARQKVCSLSLSKENGKQYQKNSVHVQINRRKTKSECFGNIMFWQLETKILRNRKKRKLLVFSDRSVCHLPKSLKAIDLFMQEASKLCLAATVHFILISVILKKGSIWCNVSWVWLSFSIFRDYSPVIYIVRLKQMSLFLQLWVRLA